jgi:hypothetical protein
VKAQRAQAGRLLRAASVACAARIHRGGPARRREGIAARSADGGTWAIERDDDACFAPLDYLKLAAETELYLGVIHFRDGEQGARRRIARCAGPSRAAVAEPVR